jgi:hypothetical protein
LIEISETILLDLLQFCCIVTERRATPFFKKIGSEIREIRDDDEKTQKTQKKLKKI